MEGLQGSFEVMPLPDLVRYLAERRRSGTLRCAQGPDEKSFVLQAGACTQASSSDAREYLGQFLMNQGLIDEDQLTQAFETQRETRVYLGRILAMIGLVEERRIQEALGLKIRESLLSVMEWTHGSFHFSDGEVPGAQPTVPVAVPLDDLLREREFRQTAWAAIRPIFPHGGLRLEVQGQAGGTVEHPLDARILTLAAEGQTIDELALTLHATPFALHQRLFALYRKGLLRPAPDDEEILVDIEEDSGPQASAASLVADARELLGRGQYTRAHDYARQAVELAPEDRSAQAALAEAETGLLANLRQQLMVRPLCPRIVATSTELRAMRFTPAERYLVKRFDGTRTLAQIIRVSPIKEVEALQIVRRLLDAGLIRLVEAH